MKLKIVAGGVESGNSYLLCGIWGVAAGRMGRWCVSKARTLTALIVEGQSPSSKAMCCSCCMLYYRSCILIDTSYIFLQSRMSLKPSSASSASCFLGRPNPKDAPKRSVTISTCMDSDSAGP